MRHGDGRTVSHAPALVGKAERRGGTGDGVQAGPAVGFIDDGRRGAAFGHGLVVETPELPPGDFGFRHEEAGDADPLLRALVVAATRLFLRASQQKFTARNGDHPDRGIGAGDGFREGFEALGGGRRLIDFAAAGIDLAFQFLMRITLDVVAGVEMAADTGKMEFLGILLVVEMGGDAIVADTLREQVLMAFQAGGVIDDPLGMVHGTLGSPVDLVLVLGHLRPQILGAHLDLDHVVTGDTVLLRRQVAGGAVGDDAAPVQVVGRLFPKQVGLLVVMAAHAGVVRGRIGVHGHQGHHRHDAQCQSPEKGAPDDALLSHDDIPIFKDTKKGGKSVGNPYLSTRKNNIP